VGARYQISQRASALHEARLREQGALFHGAVNVIY
jgi:hypothetical protein